MKRILAVVAAVALMAAGQAWAGDYHHGASLICAECHVMHYSQTHGYNPDGSGITVPLGGSGPYHYLLRNDINELCLTCHDGNSWAPDVLGINAGSNVRMAGFLNEDGSGVEASGHTLNAIGTAPGGTFSNPDGLNCINCHHQHGHNSAGNAYKNLRGSFVSYSVGTNDPLTDVYEVAALNWDVSNIFFNEPDPTASAYADWCKGCHTNFHGAKGGPEVGGATGEEWVRHPNADANIGALGGGHSSNSTYAGRTNKVHVMNPNGTWTSTDPLDHADSTPSCFSCHKAHGNANAFGLIYMSGTGTVTENGDDGTTAKDLCKQCHRQG